MIETRQKVDSRIDWIGDASLNHNNNETVLQARIHYFEMVRSFLRDIESVSNSDIPNADLIRKEIKKIFEKYNVHFVDVDDFPRINFDEPKGE